ncbi:hypothetical protein J7E70_23620 [Variovorax paradoxus]|nr:hypothetical protein [Variovorax paradoxus]MBT2303443.1 hypothetical protein [Variovorax paradoxus]
MKISADASFSSSCGCSTELPAIGPSFRADMTGDRLRALATQVSSLTATTAVWFRLGITVGGMALILMSL